MRMASGRPGRKSGRTWAIVLAGGAGTRLASLTTLPGGTEVPKQYWSLCGGRSLLADALWRAERFAPPARTLVVVAPEHREHWERELAGHPLGNVLVQPANRGTAAGLVLPLLAILGRDPRATIAVLPSDHFVADEGALEAALGSALSRAGRRELVLVGIEPEGPETQYGWVCPEDGQRISRVREFVEKPPLAVARELLGRGALWNSFILAVHGTTLLGRVRRRLPDLVRGLGTALWSSDPAALGDLYGRLPVRDFSREVLEGAEGELLVRRAEPCGWTDLGTPERVLACLWGLGTDALRPPARGAPYVLARAARAWSGTPA